MDDMDDMKNKEKSAKRSQAILDYVTGKGFYKVVGIGVGVVVLAAWFISANLGKTPQNDLIGGSSLFSYPQTVINSNPNQQTGQSDQLLEGSGTQTPESNPAAVNTETSDAAQQTNAPVQQLFVMPVAGEIVGAYSDNQPIYSPTFKDWRVHAAVDIKGEVGTPVRAMTDGTVTSIQNDLMWGTTVVVTHADGYVSKYANLGNKPTVVENTVVEVGQVIGSIGQSAQAEIGQEAHLHFVLYKDGVPVDPIAVIASVEE